MCSIPNAGCSGQVDHKRKVSGYRQASRRILVCVILILASLHAPPIYAASAGAAWLRAESAHVIVFSNLDAAAVRSYTDHIERFHGLLAAFHALTGVPILLNTSFNLMGRPIVHRVEDAVAMFFTTGLDALVIEDALFVK